MSKISSTIARTDDGTIQINFTIPWKNLEAGIEEAVEHMAPGVSIKGFRKGKAPKNKVRQHLGDEKLINHALQHLLPKVFSEAIREHQIKPALYPKFELMKAKKGEDWQVRATTAELPEVKVGDYKKLIEGELRAKSIAKPNQKDGDLSQEQKEQIVIITLLEKIKVKLPKLLLDEEVNARLARLLERIEKLGLTLENYLASIKKTSQSLREEYQKQARDSITLELILNEIAQKESVQVTDKEIEETMKTAGAQPEQKSIIKAVLTRRKTLEKLANLV